MIRTEHKQRERVYVLPRRRPLFFLFALIISVLFVPPLATAQAKRVVVIKVDGLPFGLLDSFVHERDQRTGKSKLPWFDYVFYQRGTRLSNFYTRGTSLSAPSWSTIDTGQHLQIKGNVEFDRYTLHAYDYLNFIPFYFKSAAGARIDMPGAEVLDSVGVPLVADAFAHEDRYIGFQLFQRGMRFATLREALQKRFIKSPKDLVDEWTMGFDMRTPFFEQMERELIEKLAQPNTKYVDLYISGFDHVAHHVNDRGSHFAEVRRVDALVGRIWTAIQKSPNPEETAMVVVSDHGFNTTEGVYSQGYNLVKLLGTPAGGGHHVVTKRRLMLDYALKGVNFMVPLITTTTDDSYYLTGQSTEYPTALLDFDGNERASIHLRDSDLNQLHILLLQLQRNKLSPQIQSAATNAFFQVIEGRRLEWQHNLVEINEELGALRRAIEKQQALWLAEPKKFTPEELKLGRDDQKKRVYAQLERWMGQEQSYTEYVRTLTNLLSLRKETFAPSKIKLEDLIAKNAMGERNSIAGLQNYIVGLSAGGLKLSSDGTLDLPNSFRRVDYFTMLDSVTTRNNVQPRVGNKPIDMIATRIPSKLIAPLVNEKGLAPDAVWVYGGRDKQALIIGRENEGSLSLRYLPIKNLRQDAAGSIQFDFTEWAPGFPLRFFEDPAFAIPVENRAAWLTRWHSDLDWLRALHQTRYSSGVVGLYEEIAHHSIDELGLFKPNQTSDDRLLLRFAKRQREMIETDLLVVANYHWNFDVRGFNPGGNHGSFFRISTRCTVMFAGGSQTGIPQGVLVDEPYDTLSFAPTVLALTGNLSDDDSPIPSLWNKGFRPFPGRPISEVLTLRPANAAKTTRTSVIP